MQSEKDSDGRVYVWVDDDSSEIKPRPRGEPTALIFEMKEHIALLEAGAGQGARCELGELTHHLGPYQPDSRASGWYPARRPRIPQSCHGGAGEARRGASVQYRRPLARTRFRYRPSRDVSESPFSLSNVMSYSRRL
jgi:hypothetical protein